MNWKLYLEPTWPVVVMDPAENYNKQEEIKVFHKSCIYITGFLKKHFLNYCHSSLQFIEAEYDTTFPKETNYMNSRVSSK